MEMEGGRLYGGEGDGKEMKSKLEIAHGDEGRKWRLWGGKEGGMESVGREVG